MTDTDTTTTPGADWTAWQESWDRQQEWYMPDREERFRIMLDTVEAIVGPPPGCWISRAHGKGTAPAAPVAAPAARTAAATRGSWCEPRSPGSRPSSGRCWCCATGRTSASPTPPNCSACGRARSRATRREGSRRCGPRCGRSTYGPGRRVRGAAGDGAAGASPPGCSDAVGAPGAETVFARAARVRWRRRWVVTGVAAAVAAVSLTGTGALPGHGSEQTGITGLRPTARAGRLAKLLPPGIGTIREYLDIAGAGPYDGFYAVCKDGGVGYLNIQVFPGRREDSRCRSGSGARRTSLGRRRPVSPRRCRTAMSASPPS
jgi:hypothetical protein